MSQQHKNYCHLLGFPRVGAQRELKFAQEAYWRGEQSADWLLQQAAKLREQHWKLQRAAGIDLLPVGDFALYDHVLNHIALFGCAPERFGFAGQLSLAQYFALGRGNASQPALEMTKWFDTNYHYMVPEFSENTHFCLYPEALLEELRDAQAQQAAVKPVLLGPLSFLYLGKWRAQATKEERTRVSKKEDDRLNLLPALLQQYALLLQKLAEQGVEWVQIDEPILVQDLPAAWLAAYQDAFTQLSQASTCQILLATYFGEVQQHITLLNALPVGGVHIDVVRGAEQLDAFVDAWQDNHKILSLGIVDGRNIWRADLSQALHTLQPAYATLGERLWLSSSCSLLHTPFDLDNETQLDSEMRSWLAFAKQKLQEISGLKRALLEGAVSIQDALQASDAAQLTRLQSKRVHRAAVKTRIAELQPRDFQRDSAFSVREARQQAHLNLPILPTTTIGSFPQTAEIRTQRAAFKRGALAAKEYKLAMQAEIQRAIDEQLAIGLDVLVHGEAERNDMVEYFGEQLAGFVFTENGWVQSYGSRCVKPPILFGDVERLKPMTVEWATYAQSLTTKWVKGMLTGPITILQWSFVRNDQARSETAQQIALAIRDEVLDLAAAGVAIIQIDEPALREGLPLKQQDWQAYLVWAGAAFRLASSGVADQVQIHTHMCYAEFNDILPAIAALDADVITIETSRSNMDLLQGFGEFAYPNQIGPGVYDIHSPRIPSVEAMRKLLARAQTVIPVQRLWVNPDCGLKTRNWQETRSALKNMVQATQEERASLLVVSEKVADSLLPNMA